MKYRFALLILVLPLNLFANDVVEREPPAVQQNLTPDPLTIRALEQLENKMEIQFKIPFPALLRHRRLAEETPHFDSDQSHQNLCHAPQKFSIA